jgi:hypothetical protein
MTTIQIVLCSCAALALWRVFHRFRRGGLPLLHLALWSLVWTGVMFVSLQPNATSAVARVLGVGRGADAVIYLALVLLFYVVFRVLGKIENLDRQITRLVRATALKELEHAQPHKTPEKPT